MSETDRHVLLVVENESVPADRRVWYEALALVAAGYAVSVICPARAGEQRFESRDGVDIHRYRPRPSGGGVAGFAVEFGVAWFEIARLTARVVRHRRIDALQVCNPPDVFFPLAALLRAQQVPFVFDQHDLSPEIYASRFGRDRGVVMYLLRTCERLTYRTADHVIASNAWYRNVAILRGRLRPDEVTVVRNGPDLRRMRPRAPRNELREGRKHLCLFVGVMEPHDGVDLALRAAAHVVHDLGHDDCLFAFLGDGESLPALKQLAEDLGLHDHVRFTGWAEDDQLLDYLSSADVGLQPDAKDWRTDVSTATKSVEYLAFKIPTVAFDLRETRATLGPAALYARPNESQHLGDLVAQLLEDDERRRWMGAVGRDRVEQRLSWDIQERAYVAVFDHLLATASVNAGRARAETS